MNLLVPISYSCTFKLIVFLNTKLALSPVYDSYGEIASHHLRSKQHQLRTIRRSHCGAWASVILDPGIAVHLHIHREMSILSISAWDYSVRNLLREIYQIFWSVIDLSVATRVQIKHDSMIHRAFLWSIRRFNVDNLASDCRKLKVLLLVSDMSSQCTSLELTVSPVNYRYPWR